MMTSAFSSAMDTQAASRSLGENGAPELTAHGVGSTLVTLFFKLVRGCPTADIDQLISSLKMDAAPEDLADLAVLAMQTRATRGMGKGEKSLCYELCLRLPTEALHAIIPLLPHYGYVKDFFLLLEHFKAHASAEVFTALEQQIVALLADKLRVDEKEFDAAAVAKRTPELSLTAKWVPREGTHFDKAPLSLSKLLAKELYGSANEQASKRKYRKLISRLNAALNTTEALMAAQRWEEIEFGRVASLCLNRYRKAFLNERLKGKLLPCEEATGNRHPDDARRVAARANLRKALLSKAGLKGKALQPHELASKFILGYRNKPVESTAEIDVLESQWVSMRAGVKEALDIARIEHEERVLASAAPGATVDDVAALKAALPSSIDLGKLVPLVDVSGSMTGTPMEVAVALGILVSELTHPAFANRLLTFESRPQWVDLTGCVGLKAKVEKTTAAPWGGSTNFEAACELILKAAQQAKLKPDEVPDLIVFSDMQFNTAGGFGGSWETHFERLQRRFAEVGRAVCGEPYAAPKIVFWNLRGDTKGYPADANAPNTQMLSGFSPSLLKLVLTGAEMVGEEKEVVLPDGTVAVVKEGPTPAETVRAALDSADFAPVRVALAAITTGPLAAYTYVAEEKGMFDTEEFEIVDAAAA